MESRLRAWAAPGGPIGRLEDGRYGVVHEASIMDAALRDTLEAQAQAAGLPKQSYRVGAHRVELAGEGGGAERSDAITFALWNFAKGVGGRFRLRSLGESLAALNAELRQRLRQLASAETPTGVPALYRPVLNLTDWTVALADVAPIGAGAPTSPNLRGGWDAALLRYALAMLEKQPSPFPFPLVSARLAARTLGGRELREPLLAALLQHPAGAHRMVIEIDGLDPGDDDALAACERLKGLGARLAVRHPGQADALVSLLAAVGPAFVRAPADLLLAKGEPRARQRLAGSLARLAGQFDAALSIDGVADRALLDEVRDAGVALASGDALAKAAEDPSMVWGPGLRDRKNRPIAARPVPAPNGPRSATA
jgi:EAL domain-containing protein (putative c-di-GMP-specific phosphodiesterase class I)